MPSPPISELGVQFTPGSNRWNDRFDFVIDGEPLKDCLIRQEEARGRINEISSLPSFKGLFRSGLSHHRDSFLTGYAARRQPPFSNLAPVMACECGETVCGGVWTKIFVSSNYVNWSGFRFWDSSSIQPSPTYDSRMRVFDRTQYESLIAQLVDRDEDTANE